MMFSRRPPMPKVTIECPWCGVEETAKRRRWHPDCVTAYRIACFSSDQRHALWKRDHGVCAECGIDNPDRFERWERLLPRILRPEAFERLKPNPYIDYRSYYTGVTPVWITTWHADHRMPLWRAPRNLPLADRNLWWGLENLQTLCEVHHKAKTAREAAQRAALKSGQPRLELIA